MTALPAESSVLEPTAPESDRFRFQCGMLEKGFQEVQRQIGRFDDIAFRIKTSAATVWVGLVGWSFTTEKASIVLLAFVILPGFWMLEALFRATQNRYIEKSRELSAFLNDEVALERSFASRQFPPGIVYPVGLRENEWRNLLRFLRACISPHVATLYLFLALANVLLWLAMDLVVRGEI